jgi:PHP family Zn ribbon phosphoesterase
MYDMSVTYNGGRSDYFKVKQYLLSCDANDFFPERIDRFFNDTYVCCTEEYILEAQFDDKIMKIIYYQIYDRFSGEYIENSESNCVNIIKKIDLEAYDYHLKCLGGLLGYGIHR